MAHSTPSQTLPPPGKPSAHRKAWLNRIAGRSTGVGQLVSSITSILLLVLVVLTPTSSAQITTDGTGSSGFVMPRAFDASVGNNFTQSSCENWFTNFITTIQPCHPISLMLQTSISYFDATKSLVSITRVLDNACQVDYPRCAALMSKLTSELMKSDVCQQDYNYQNPVLTQAYAGLLAYQPVYGATCLKQTGPVAATSTVASSSPKSTSAADGSSPFGGGNARRQTPLPGSGAYCYANAVTNTTSPSASYFYYLPLGISLPGGTIPTCNTCLQSTMKSFAPYATNSSQPLSKTYTAAASDVNMFCGPTFVDQNVASAGEALARPWTKALWTVGGLLGVWLIA